MTDSQPPRPHGETAGHYMVTSLPVARPATLAQDVIEAVRGRTLRKFDRPLVVPGMLSIEPGLAGAALLGLEAPG